MANENPQAIRIANEKLRPAADRMGQLYNFAKSLQAEYVAEGWPSLFPNDAELIVDGSASDGRTPITNADILAFMGHVNTFIVSMEASTMAMRNNVLKIAVNPERF
jgi:hypothetical protein